jgi:hypothetical protein
MYPYRRSRATGVYWKPVCHVLVVNAQHMKAVLGRKARREVGERVAPWRKRSEGLLFHQQYTSSLRSTAVI